MAAALTLEGIITPIVTPMSVDGSAIDIDAAGPLVERLLAAGIAGIVVCGSTGEFTALTFAERTALAECVIAIAAGRCSVIVHTGAVTTAEAEALTDHARQAGAAAVMALPPYFEVPSLPELRAHYERIRRAAGDVPIVMYHYPAASKVTLTTAELAELCATADATYVKDSSNDPSVLSSLLIEFGDVVRTLVGADPLLFYGLAAGAPGAISVVSNIAPGLCVELREALTAFDRDRALSLWQRLWPLCELLESEPYIAVAKRGCELAGTPVGSPRPPMFPLSAEGGARLTALLSDSMAQAT